MTFHTLKTIFHLRHPAAFYSVTNLHVIAVNTTVYIK